MNGPAHPAITALDGESQLVFSLGLGKLSEAEFFRQYPASPDEKQWLGLRALQSALLEKNAVAVERGSMLGHYFGLTEDYVDVFERLLVEEWHQKHEVIVFALGKLKSPTSIEPIFAAAQSHHPYLEEYDDSFQLRSKCIHALRNIGTLPAVRRLWELFEKLEDPELKAKVVRRFQDLVSKGTTEELREAARAALARTGAASS